MTPSTPTWRAGDEENGEGQFGGVSHFPFESDPLTSKRIQILKNTQKCQSDWVRLDVLLQQGALSLQKAHPYCRVEIQNIPDNANRTSPKSREDEEVVVGISRSTHERWHPSQDYQILARSAALLRTDVFTCASWWLTCYYHTSGSGSRATAGQS